ncbi:MAG: hypothetical protein DYG89_04065 [Caldilinea sp. CFX5]|nr:hypothetical protein [Caldilinea sp. CFX5]
MSTKSIREPFGRAIIIHHTTLADMLQAIPPLAPVYADRYDRSHREYQHLITHNVIVCVRAYISETGIIHSYTPYRAQTMRHSTEDTKDLDQLWDKAGAILDDISAAISQDRRIYRGIIDLGPVEAVAGQPWQVRR